jgi:hypothetical protein
VRVNRPDARRQVVPAAQHDYRRRLATGQGVLDDGVVAGLQRRGVGLPRVDRGAGRGEGGGPVGDSAVNRSEGSFTKRSRKKNPEFVIRSGLRFRMLR